MDDARRAVVLATALLGPVALVAPPGVRGVLSLVVMLIAPGTAVVRLVGLPNGLSAIVVAVGSGVAITQGVTLILMYLHLWSWQAALMALCAISFGLAAVPVPAGGSDVRLPGIRI